MVKYPISMAAFLAFVAAHLCDALIITGGDARPDGQASPHVICEV
jgi:hypothetical protein